MRRSIETGIMALCALLVLLLPLTSAAVSVDKTSANATLNEATCLAGAQQSCSDQATLAFLNCAETFGLTWEDVENGTTGVYVCATWGTLAYVWCSIVSIFA